MAKSLTIIDMEPSRGPVAASHSGVYYAGQYWNDFPLVQRELNRRATGNTQQLWYKHFFKHYPGPYKKVLMLNCGNGWVERELYEQGYITELVGVDYAEDLLAEARTAAKDLPFRYYQMDINSAKFPEADFDLIINHAAGHHVARLDAVCRELLQLITPQGLFLNYDYIGPHRNQYPFESWAAAYQLNQSLPPSCRQDMRYPHLPTMIATDPSEAVHAELVVPIMQRYFKFVFFKPLGGALAYPLLTHNAAIQTARRPAVESAVRTILTADTDYLHQHPDSSLFAYWVGQPKKAVLRQSKQLANWRQAEMKLERYARQHAGHYYELTTLQAIYLELENYRVTAEHKQAYIDQIHRQLDNERAKRKQQVRQLSQTTKELQRKDQELQAVYASRTWRFGRWLARLKNLAIGQR